MKSRVGFLEVTTTLTIMRAFFRSAVYGIRARGNTRVQKNKIKHDWGHEVLKIFGYQIEIKGKPPKNGACILVGNHISYLDIPLLLAAAPFSNFIAKDDLKSWPIIGQGADAVGTLFVKRKAGSDRTAVRNQIIKHFSEHPNFQLVVFPSGTTTLDESVRWKKGIFEIAKEIKVPVQLFHITYEPLRESAYIAEDNLLIQMRRAAKFKNKKAMLTWLEEFLVVDDPVS